MEPLTRLIAAAEDQSDRIVIREIGSTGRFCSGVADARRSSVAAPPLRSSSRIPGRAESDEARSEHGEVQLSHRGFHHRELPCHRG